MAASSTRTQGPRNRWWRRFHDHPLRCFVVPFGWEPGRNADRPNTYDTHFRFSFAASCINPYVAPSVMSAMPRSTNDTSAKELRIQLEQLQSSQSKSFQHDVQTKLAELTEQDRLKDKADRDEESWLIFLFPPAWIFLPISLLGGLFEFFARAKRNRLRPEQAAEAVRDAHRNQLEELAARIRLADSRSESTAASRSVPDSSKPWPAPGKTAHPGRPAPRSKNSGALGSSNRSSGGLGTSHNIPAGLNASFDPVISSTVKLEVANRDNWVCQLCLKSINRHDLDYDFESPNPDRLEIDHIKPVSHGGGNERSNLQATHRRCNQKKSGRNISNALYRAWSAEADTTVHRREPASSWRATGERSHKQGMGDRERPAVGMLSPIGEAINPEQQRRSDEFWATPHTNTLFFECDRGHPFSDDNTYYSYTDYGIQRQCRSCRRLAR